MRLKTRDERPLEGTVAQTVNKETWTSPGTLCREADHSCLPWVPSSATFPCPSPSGHAEHRSCLPADLATQDERGEGRLCSGDVAFI